MSEEKKFKIDISLLVVLIIVLSVIVIGFFIYKNRSVGIVVVSPQIARTQQLIKPEFDEVISLSQDGIDVTIEDVKKIDGKVRVLVYMDNHRFDLGDPMIKERTTLDGRRAEEFNVLTTGMGGHHVEAEFVFLQEDGKNLNIGVTDTISLRIEIL